MELILIKQSSKEWEYLWGWISEHPLNKGLENPMDAPDNETGFMWEYMGSFKQKERVIHEMRHLHHPLTKKIESLKLNSSKNFNIETDIEKTFKLK